MPNGGELSYGVYLSLLQTKMKLCSLSLVQDLNLHPQITLTGLKKKTGIEMLWVCSAMQTLLHCFLLCLLQTGWKLRAAKYKLSLGASTWRLFSIILYKLKCLVFQLSVDIVLVYNTPLVHNISPLNQILLL